MDCQFYQVALLLLITVNKTSLHSLRKAVRMDTMNWNPSQYWEILKLQYLIKPCVYWFCEPPEKQIKNC